MFVEVTCVKDNSIVLDQKIYLSDLCNKWFASFGIANDNYNCIENTWENDKFIIMTHYSFEYKKKYDVVGKYLWPIISEHIEVLKYDEYKLQTPTQIYLCYKKFIKHDIDLRVKDIFHACRTNGFEIIDNYYYSYDNINCFDPQYVCKKNIPTVPHVDKYSILTLFQKYHDNLKRIGKHKIDTIEISSKIEPRFITKSKSNLTELKLSDQTIEKLKLYENIVYSFQGGDSHIWFVRENECIKYVIKMSPYDILFNHELSMLQFLQTEDFVPRVIDSWSYPGENFIVMSYEGTSLSDLYIKECFSPTSIKKQIEIIKSKLKTLNLEHLDCHEGNWLVDIHGKVSLIDLEHLIPLDKSQLSNKYIKHIEDYFPEENEE